MIILLTEVVHKLAEKTLMKICGLFCVSHKCAMKSHNLVYKYLMILLSLL